MHVLSCLPLLIAVGYFLPCIVVTLLPSVSQELCSRTRLHIFGWAPSPTYWGYIHAVTQWVGSSTQTGLQGCACFLAARQVPGFYKKARGYSLAAWVGRWASPETSGSAPDSSSATLAGFYFLSPQRNQTVGLSALSTWRQRSSWLWLVYWCPFLFHGNIYLIFQCDFIWNTCDTCCIHHYSAWSRGGELRTWTHNGLSKFPVLFQSNSVLPCLSHSRSSMNLGGLLLQRLGPAGDAEAWG